MSYRKEIPVDCWGVVASFLCNSRDLLALVLSIEGILDRVRFPTRHINFDMHKFPPTTKHKFPYVQKLTPRTEAFDQYMFGECIEIKYVVRSLKRFLHLRIIDLSEVWLPRENVIKIGKHEHLTHLSLSLDDVSNDESESCEVSVLELSTLPSLEHLKLSGHSVLSFDSIPVKLRSLELYLVKVRCGKTLCDQLETLSIEMTEFPQGNFTFSQKIFPRLSHLTMDDIIGPKSFLIDDIELETLKLHRCSGKFKLGENVFTSSMKSFHCIEKQLKWIDLQPTLREKCPNLNFLCYKFDSHTANERAIVYLLNITCIQIGISSTTVKLNIENCPNLREIRMDNSLRFPDLCERTRKNLKKLVILSGCEKLLENEDGVLDGNMFPNLEALEVTRSEEPIIKRFENVEKLKEITIEYRKVYFAPSIIPVDDISGLPETLERGVLIQYLGVDDDSYLVAKNKRDFMRYFNEIQLQCKIQSSEKKDV